MLVKVGFVDRDPRILPEMSAKVAFLSRPPTAAEEKPENGGRGRRRGQRGTRKPWFLS